MITFHSDMDCPKSPRSADFPNYQAYLDAYDTYCERMDAYHVWKESQPARDQKAAALKSEIDSELAAMAKRYEEDELLVYASLQALKADQLYERIRRAIEDD